MDTTPHRIRNARLKKGLTQKELAEQAGVKQNYISYVERGQRRIFGDILTRVAKVLDVSESYLIGDDTGNIQQRVAADVNLQHGLRDLARDKQLIKALKVTGDELHTLASVSLVGPVSKDGYVQLLFTIRAISNT